MSAELKLATQQNMFLAHVRRQEDGSKHISRMVVLNEVKDKEEEMKLSEEEGAKTVKINRKLLEELK